MEQLKSLNDQIGGSHYKNLVQQPIEFITKASLSFIQGNIVKYITRYKHKNGKQDVEKIIHYANLAIDLKDEGPNAKMLNLAYSYCKANELSSYQTNIIIACVQDDYYGVLRYCKQLLKSEYPD